MTAHEQAWETQQREGRTSRSAVTSSRVESPRARERRTQAGPRSGSAACEGRPDRLSSLIACMAMHAERVRPSRNGVTGNHGSSPLSGISLAVPCPVITTPTIRNLCLGGRSSNTVRQEIRRGHGQPRGCCRRRSERTLVRVGPRLPRFPRAGTDPRPAALRSHALTTSRRRLWQPGSTASRPDAPVGEAPAGRVSPLPVREDTAVRRSSPPQPAFRRGPTRVRPARPPVQGGALVTIL